MVFSELKGAGEVTQMPGLHLLSQEGSQCCCLTPVKPQQPLGQLSPSGFR